MSRGFLITCQPYTNLKALALVCRELAPIAQDVLFRNPVVNNHPLNVSSSGRDKELLQMQSSRIISTLGEMRSLIDTYMANPVMSGPGAFDIIKHLNSSTQDVLKDPELWWRDRIVQLERALEYRPALAQKMRSLNLDLMGKAGVVSSHSAGLSVEYMQTYPYRRLNALLSRMYRLEHITLNFKRPFSTRLLENWLGTEGSQLASFSQLTSLKTNFLPPWPVLTLPALRELHIDTRFLDLSRHREGYARWPEWEDIDEEFQNDANYLFGVDLLQKGLRRTGGLSQILSLIIDFDAEILTWCRDPAINRHFYAGLKELLALLKVEAVQLRLCHNNTRCRYYPEDERLSYGELSGFLDQQNLRTAIIDTSELDWDNYFAGCFITLEDYAVFPLHHEDEDFENDYNPTKTPRLCRIVIPQEALFHHHKRPDEDFRSFRPISLPQTVESVEVIDSTRALNHWARYVLENPGEYPKLKQVVLWCDRNQVPLASESQHRLINVDEAEAELLEDEDFGQDEIYEPDDYGEIHVLKDDVPDDVWMELEKSGISLVKHTERNQGWRDIA
jgi:hypothetical protein